MDDGVELLVAGGVVVVVPVVPAVVLGLFSARAFVSVKFPSAPFDKQPVTVTSWLLSPVFPYC
jgi:hypothetical protein